jgi:hypothetical protein
MIRAPFIFRAAWNIFKHVVDPHVRDLLEIATEGTETEQVLARYMDLSVLPPEMGIGTDGTTSTSTVSGRGKAARGFEQTIWTGGKLPPPSDNDWHRDPPIHQPNDSDSCLHSTNATTTKARNSPPGVPLKGIDDKVEEGHEVTWHEQQLQHTPSIRLRQETSRTYLNSEGNTDDDDDDDDDQIGEEIDGSFENVEVTSSRLEQLLNTTATTTTTMPFFDVTHAWRDHHFEDMAQLWQLTESEQKDLKEFQYKIFDIQHWKNDPFEVVRYYREYHGQLLLAVKKFRAMIDWRREVGLDDPKHPKYGNYDYHAVEHGDAEQQRRQRHEPHALLRRIPIAMLHGTDYEGDPIIIDRLGVADYYHLLKHFGPDAITDHFIFLDELNTGRSFWKHYYDSHKKGDTPFNHSAGPRHPRVRQFNMIIDLYGLSRQTHLRPGMLPLLKSISRIAQDNYAGWSKRILLIRAPHVFKWMWNLVKFFFDPHIRDMIQVASGDDLDESLAMLDKFMDRRVLPPILCPEQGKGTVVPGYFETVSLEGGPIPLEEFEAAAAEAAEASNKTTMTTTTTLITKAKRNNQKPPSIRRAATTGAPTANTRIMSATPLMVGCWHDSEDVDDDDGAGCGIFGQDIRDMIQVASGDQLEESLSMLERYMDRSVLPPILCPDSLSRPSEKQGRRSL